MNAAPHTGACACGAVTFRASVEKRYGVCHCRTCRRWVGGPWMAANAGAAPEIAGPVKRWRSSEDAERGSCATCGGALFFHRFSTERYYLALGLFDDQDGWTRASEIFEEERPTAYAFLPSEGAAA